MLVLLGRPRYQRVRNFPGDATLFERFSSDRLDVLKVSTYDSELVGGILDLLSVNAKVHLPDDWQDIDDINKAKLWLQQILIAS